MKGERGKCPNQNPRLGFLGFQNKPKANTGEGEGGGKWGNVYKKRVGDILGTKRRVFYPNFFDRSMEWGPSLGFFELVM